MVLAVIAAVVLLIDQLSKAYIRQSMAVGDSNPIISGIFHITHVKNPGAAFGILPNKHLMFLFVGIAVIIVMLYFYKQLGSANKAATLAFGLVLGGAAGNLIDRVRFGTVTDFLDFRVWPVFNVADSAIVVGMIFVSILLIVQARKESAHAGQVEG